MGLAYREWAAFIAKETNATTPFCLILSNIMDQKEVALHVTLHESSKCPLHVLPSNESNMRKRDPVFSQAFLYLLKDVKGKNLLSLTGVLIYYFLLEQ